MQPGQAEREALWTPGSSPAGRARQGSFPLGR